MNVVVTEGGAQGNYVDAAAAGADMAAAVAAAAGVAAAAVGVEVECQSCSPYEARPCSCPMPDGMWHALQQVRRWHVVCSSKG